MRTSHNFKLKDILHITNVDIIVLIFFVLLMFFFLPKAFGEDIPELDITWQQALASQISQAWIEHQDDSRKCKHYICEMQVDEIFHDKVNSILIDFHLKTINKRSIDDQRQETYNLALKVLATYSSYLHSLDENFTDMDCELAENKMVYRINSILSFYKLFYKK